MNDTRKELVAAARAHLDAHGLEGLTLRQIARAVQVSHGAPLRHFSGLSSMLSAVTAEAFDELVATVSRHVDAAEDDPLRRLRAAGQGYVEFAIANPGPYELMFRPERLDRTDADYLRAALAAFDQLAVLTAAAQAAGWRAGLDSAVLTGVLWAGVHGIASLWIQGSLPIATNSDELDQFLSVFQIDLAGLPTTEEK
jgi:AcrR family transcriptional regulator